MAENQPPGPLGGPEDDGGVPQRRFAAPAGSTTVLLVRHGASEPAHPEREFPTVDGHGDPALAPEGHDQAELLGRRLAEEHRGSPFGGLYVTTLRRTHQTAAPLASATGLVPRVEPRLREVHLGEWEGGLLRLKGAAGDPLVREVYSQERWDVIPGAETWEAFQQRCVAGLEELVGRHRGERIVAVVHGGVIAALLSHVAASRRFAFVSADNASISEIVHLGDPIDRWVLRRFNDCTHLDLGGGPLSR